MHSEFLQHFNKHFERHQSVSWRQTQSHRYRSSLNRVLLCFPLNLWKIKLLATTNVIVMKYAVFVAVDWKLIPCCETQVWAIFLHYLRGFDVDTVCVYQNFDNPVCLIFLFFNIFVYNLQWKSFTINKTLKQCRGHYMWKCNLKCKVFYDIWLMR